MEPQAFPGDVEIEPRIFSKNTHLFSNYVVKNSHILF